MRFPGLHARAAEGRVIEPKISTTSIWTALPLIFFFFLHPAKSGCLVALTLTGLNFLF